MIGQIGQLPKRHASSCDGADAAEEGEGKGGRLIPARGYPVFNAAQVSGYKPEAMPQEPTAERIQHAEEFFSALNADSGSARIHGG